MSNRRREVEVVKEEQRAVLPHEVVCADLPDTSS